MKNSMISILSRNKIMVKHMSRMTHRKKREYYPKKIENEGNKCLYCKGPFTDTNPPEWEHLNNNSNDSRLENMALSHKACNNKKKFNSDYQIIANEKLLENEKAVFACERTLADSATTKEVTSQQEINKINFKIAEQFIQEHTLMEGSVILRDAVNAIVAVCRDNNETGSQAAVYRYIDTIANPYTGKYTLSTNAEGKNIIRRRTEN